MTHTWTHRVEGDHPYDVVVGRDLLREVGQHVGPAQRVAVIHAEGVTESAQVVAASIHDAGREVVDIAIPDGEQAKSVEVAASCWSLLGRGGFTRGDCIVGVGGGAATDLAGFVAATWLRGIRLVQVPTTLLAMVDAAVGGKTGINTAQGKNLVGSFHAPAAVVCDLEVLRTLPPAEVSSGLAEVVKCGFIADPRILDRVEQHPAACLDVTSDDVTDLVQRAVAVKADIVGRDFTESGDREFLNYGHTLGHAIEQSERFQIRHGEAIAIGMVFAAELSCLAGRLSRQVVDQHRKLLTTVGLPTSYPGGQWPQLLQAMQVDKKTRGSQLRFVVLDGVGRPGRLEGPTPELLAAAYAEVSS